MNSPEIVSALRAGAPGAAEKLYDSFAEGLYQFCWFMLRNRETAKVALRDAIVLGEAHIAKLSDPETLKPWLYALARAECQRRESPSAGETDEPIARPDQQDADLRLMAWNSVMSLDPAERTAIDLVTRHGMEPPDAALVMGMPLPGTEELLAAARSGLEQALAAEILVSRGSHECAGRTDAMRGWAGTVTPVVRERLLRHAGSCPRCLSALPRNVSMARVFSLLPAPALPRAMRARVLGCFSDPELSDYRTFAAGRHTAFDAAGFPAAGPVPGMADDERGAGAAGGHGRRLLAGFGAAAAAAVAAVVFVFGGLGGSTVLNGDAGGFSAGAGHPGRATGAQPSLRPGAAPTAAGGRIGLPAPVAPTPAAGHPQAFTGQGPVPAAGGSSRFIMIPPQIPQGGGRGSPPPGPTIPPQPSPGPAGHLQVSPASLSLGTGSQGQIVLTAAGGPVTWAASTSSADVTLSDASGQLSAGQSVTVAVTVSRQAGAGGSATVYIDPGTTPVQVSWDASPSPSPSPSVTTTAATAPAPPQSPSPSPSLSSSLPPAPSPAPSGLPGPPNPS
jgi:DNA-directed RNA polymerase specialized sigma24 family protein